MPQAPLSSDPGHEMAATQAIQWFSFIWRFKMRSFRLCTTPLLLGDGVSLGRLHRCRSGNCRCTRSGNQALAGEMCTHAQALTNLSRSGIRFGDFTWGLSRIYQTNIEVQNGPPLAFVDPCGPIGHRSGFPARLFGRFLFRLDFVLFLASAFLVPCCCRFGYSCRFAAAETKAKTI